MTELSFEKHIEAWAEIKQAVKDFIAALEDEGDLDAEFLTDPIVQGKLYERAIERRGEEEAESDV